MNEKKAAEFLKALTEQDTTATPRAR